MGVSYRNMIVDYNNVHITKEEMDDFFFSPKKGWVRHICGNEYVYDYHMKSPFPLVLKVMSSVNVCNRMKRNKGSNVIRVFVVLKNGCDINSKIVRGFFKAKRIDKTINWRENLKNEILKIHKDARKRYEQKCLSK